MALGSIVIDLLLKTGAFTTDAKTAEKRLRELQKTAVNAGKVLGSAIAVGAGLAAAALKSTIDNMDEMSKAAQKVSLPTEQFSQLAYAGSLADVAVADLEGALGKLTRSQAAANKETSNQAKIFSALGIATHNASGAMRSSIDVLYDFADRFQELQGSPEATAAGMELFGRSFQKLIPLIKDGSQGLKDAADESDRFGTTLDTEAGRAAEAFNDNLTRLSSIAKGFTQDVAVGLLPALEEASGELVSISRSGELAGNVVTVLSGVFSAGVAAIDAYNAAIRITSAAMTTFVAVGEGYSNAVRNIWAPWSDGTVADGVKQMKTAMADFSVLAAPTPASPFANVRSSASTSRPSVDASSLRSAVNAALGDAPKVAKAIKEVETEAEKAAKALQDSFDRTNESMHQQIALHGQVGEAAKLNYELQHGSLKGLTAAQGELLTEQAKWLDFLADQAALEEVWADARQDQTDQMIAQWNSATNEMTVYAEQAGRNMQDAFADFLFDPFEDGLSGMLQSFADTLQRMAAEMAASEAMKALAGYGEANSGSWWGQALSSFFGGGRAAGGPVSGSKLYEVGEGGNPELFKSGSKTYLIPGANGTVVPATGAGGAAAMGASVNIEIINNSGAEVRTERSQTPDGRALERIIIGTVQQGFGRGEFDGAMGMFGNQRRGVPNG